MSLSVEIFLFYLPLIILTVCFSLIKNEIHWSKYIFAIFLGMLAIIPGTVIQFLVPDFIKIGVRANSRINMVLVLLLLKCLILNGIIEEVCKGACLCIMKIKKYSLPQFVKLGVIAGLSFGTFENVIYIVAGVKNPELRMISSVLVHCVCTALDGIFVWGCFRNKCHVSVLLTAVFVHGLYNFFASLPGVWWVISLFALSYGFFQIVIFYQMFDVSENNDIHADTKT